MSDTAREHRHPHPQLVAAPYLEFDVARALEQLHREAGWHSGQNATTLVKYDGLRIVVILDSLSQSAAARAAARARTA